MTTGSLSTNVVAFNRNGWDYYDYSSKSWNGGDTPASDLRPKKTFSSYTFQASKKVKGKVVYYPKTILRRNPSPARSRRPPPHDYVMSYKEMKQDWFSFRWSNGSQYGEGGLINELPFTSRWSSNDDIVLLSKLRERIASSSFNAGVSLGEAPKALDMIAEHAKRMRLFYTNFRKGNFLRARDELFGGRKALKRPSRAAASNFLAVKYGWLPLLNDVSEGAAFVATMFNAPRVTRVSVTRTAMGDLHHDYDAAYWGLNGGSTIMATMKRVESKRIVASITEVDVPQLAGLQDPLSVAWELVPYSFVVDWFIPVGSWLQARALSQSLTASYVTTYRHHEELSHLWLNTPGTWGYALDRRIDRGSWKRGYMTRTVSSVLPVPPYPVVKPLGSSASWARAVTSLALLLNLKR